MLPTACELVSVALRCNNVASAPYDHLRLREDCAAELLQNSGRYAELILERANCPQYSATSGMKRLSTEALVDSCLSSDAARSWWPSSSLCMLASS